MNVPETHPPHGIGDSPGLLAIDSRRETGFNGTETASSRAGIP
jgi:hypothetical protein